MIHALVRVALTALLVAGCGSKKKSEKKEEEPPAARAVDEPEGAKGSGWLDRSKQLGKRAYAGAKDKGEGLAETGGDVGRSAWSKSRGLARSSVDDVRALSTKIASKGGDGATHTINGMLDALARDPDAKVSTEARVARMIVLMVPIVGPSKRFIDARKLYAVASARAEEKRKQEARREALIAFVEAGLDIGTLGLVGSRVDLVATGADKVLSALKMSRRVGTLVGTNLKVFDDLLDSLLTYDDVRNNIDAALGAGNTPLVEAQ